VCVSHPGTIYRMKKKKKNNSTQVHDWVVYRFGDILGSVGHRVKIDKSTPATGKERDDIDFKDYMEQKTLLLHLCGLAKTPRTDGPPFLLRVHSYWTLL
jgi:hypothetical protein